MASRPHYYCVEGQPELSFWIPLDPVARDAALEYVRGSHRWGKRFRPCARLHAPLWPNDLEEPPDIEALRPTVDLADWDMQPGDAIAFSFRTVHAAPGNRAATPRRVFSARWVGDDAVSPGARVRPRRRSGSSPSRTARRSTRRFSPLSRILKSPLALFPGVARRRLKTRQLQALLLRALDRVS